MENFRPLKSWMYLTDRTSITDMNKSGIYNHFSPFWNIYTTPSADKDKWTFTQKNSIIDPFGKVLQTEDALNRPSADLYGYNHNFVIVLPLKSYYRQIAFDGFAKIMILKTEKQIRMNVKCLNTLSLKA